MSMSKPADGTSGWGDEFRFAIDTANWLTGGLPSGDLTAYYRFDDATGTSLSDATGNALTGTWSGTLANAQWGTGKLRGCGVFNGTDRIVTINDANALDFTTGLTVSLWINPSATQVAFATPFGKTSAYWIEHSGTANQNQYVWLLNNGADVQIGGFVSLTAATWTHLALTYDGTTANTYVNGVASQSLAVTSPIATNANNLILGNRTGFTRFYNGSMDELGLWPRALAFDEITSLYNGGIGTTYGVLANRIGPGNLGHYNGNLGFFGKAPATQGATPVTLADVIALLQRYGLAP
jgi:hypothetical protein